jgi:hypothetical protein
MAIQTGKDLLEKPNASTTELQKSIAALKQESEYVRKCINAGLRDYSSGQTVIEEISKLIEQLEQKLKCLTD